MEFRPERTVCFYSVYFQPNNEAYLALTADNDLFSLLNFTLSLCLSLHLFITISDWVWGEFNDLMLTVKWVLGSFNS